MVNPPALLGRRSWEDKGSACSHPPSPVAVAARSSSANRSSCSPGRAPAWSTEVFHLRGEAENCVSLFRWEGSHGNLQTAIGAASGRGGNQERCLGASIVVAPTAQFLPSTHGDAEKRATGDALHH